MITLDKFRELPPAERIMALVQVEALRKRRNRIDWYYPETGQFRRELYRKHIAFFAAGSQYRERAAMAANQIGKTEGMGAYETALHLTGQYPTWWPGRRFTKATNGIAAGKTNESTRDIIQAKLFGPVQHLPDGTRKVSGTGMIRGELIGRINWKSGVPDLIDTAQIKHADGTWSLLSLRSYQQGRAAFEGMVRHFIWLDEEPPFDIYGECLIRTANTNGLIMGTFTPLDGITETVMHFLPADLMSKIRAESEDDAPTPEISITEGVIEITPSRCMVMAGWDDVPHLSEETKSELLSGTPEYLRKARSKGIPTLGDGAIFPIDESLITCTPFAIPDHWAQIGALDFGWDHPTAYVKLAHDRDTDIIYVTHAYAKSKTVIPLHATHINSHGTWIPVAWPHDGYQTRDMTSGEQMAQQYRNSGVNMRPLNAQFAPTAASTDKVSTISVEAGIQEMLTRMQTGRWKVFSTCELWFQEFRLYRRENGRIVKVLDDVLCVHSDTTVITDAGPKRIADLVGTSGVVLTTDGGYENYTNCRRTRINTAMVEVMFDDGFRLLCTPDHQLLSEDGSWVNASESTGTKCHNAVSRGGHVKWKKSSSTVSVLLGLVTTGAALASSCIVRFMRNITDLFRRVSTFITKITTKTIMRQRISNSKAADSICPTIRRDTADIRMPHWLGSRSGGRQMRAEPLRIQWGSATSISCDQKPASPANVVASNLWRKLRARIGSALTLARLGKDARMARTVSTQTASSAIKPSKQTDSNLRFVAPGLVGERCGWLLQKAKPIRKTSRVLQVNTALPSDAYCMEVENTSAFAIGNGVVVHNCASRYAMMDIRYAETPPIEKRRNASQGHRKHPLIL